MSARRSRTISKISSRPIGPWFTCVSAGTIASLPSGRRVTSWAADGRTTRARTILWTVRIALVLALGVQRRLPGPAAVRGQGDGVPGAVLPAADGGGADRLAAARPARAVPVHRRRARDLAVPRRHARQRLQLLQLVRRHRRRPALRQLGAAGGRHHVAAAAHVPATAGGVGAGVRHRRSWRSSGGRQPSGWSRSWERPGSS